ncbi:SRPBCC family protein [Pseudomonas chlororaphis subsp. piscium]|nr:SRPBCC family protein [Pseudomonas chlororaphis subsp. piscium]
MRSLATPFCCDLVELEIATLCYLVNAFTIYPCSVRQESKGLQIRESIKIEAAPAQIFALYQDVAGWASWDPEVVRASLPDGLALNARGWLKPTTGPKAKIRVVEVTKGKSFSIASRLPLCNMLFGHDLVEVEGATLATHWVTFSGPLSFLFRRLVGSQIQASLPRTMRGLKRASEVSIGR